jgi:long-chain acyl-CoA synthetase
VRNGFGHTESGTGNIVTPDDAACQRPGTAGGPIVNAFGRIGRVGGDNDPGCGEVVIGGPCVSSGHLHDEEATKALFVAGSAPPCARAMSGNGWTDRLRLWTAFARFSSWRRDGYTSI